MNFCTACGEKLGEGINFCGSCGNQVRRTNAAPSDANSDGASPQNLKSIEGRARYLLDLASDSETNTALIDEMLEAHGDCFTSDLCEVCEYIDEELFDDLLVRLAGNPALTALQQNVVFRYGIEWQGAIVGVIGGFLGNPAIADDIKTDCLSAEEFVAYHVGDDLADVMQNYLTSMRQNTRFTAEEIQKFEKICGQLEQSE